ncbi:MAG: cytochrome c3 family protein [bacterium]|nr:cytochrome c3 family protein [bacterium]
MTIKRGLLLLGFLFWALPGWAQDKNMVEKLGDMLSPGPLSKSHFYLETTLGCMQCHTLNKGVSDLLCLECHQEIKSRIDQRLGWHGLEANRSKDCLSCHTDHKGREGKLFDPAQVDHSKLKLDLTGKHQPLKCEECHQPKYQSEAVRSLKIDQRKREGETFLGLTEDCLSCHGKEHGPQFQDQQCSSCHTDQAWSLTKFDHEKQSDFKLRGKHRKLTCIACHHKDEKHPDFAPFEKLGQQCSTCHADPHQGRSGEQCASCHSPEDWSKMLDPKEAKGFDHQKTRFKLVGVHKRVDCEKCHTSRDHKDFKRKGFSLCTDCHKDPHQAQFAPDTCSRCHDLSAKWGKEFKHDKTDFPIKQLHSQVKCKDCHPKGQYLMGEKASCEGCHYAVRSAMEGAWLDKQGQPIGPDPMFRTVNCATCHKQEHQSVTYKKVREACVECHNEHFGDLWDYREKKYGPRKEALTDEERKERLKRTHRFGDFAAPETK